MIEKNSEDVELKCKHGPRLHVTCTNSYVLPNFCKDPPLLYPNNQSVTAPL